MHGYCEGMYFFEDTEFISQTFLTTTRFLSFFLAGSIFLIIFAMILWPRMWLFMLNTRLTVYGRWLPFQQ